MGLTKYKEKRNFKESPEPQGGTAKGDKLIFVVQKHDASHLHYDLRLEMEGVLKSWAVPKGPSADPSIKRLAMMVEDHPFDYRNFEGIIPSGYGAGTVIVWDEGTYEQAGGEGLDKKTQDKNLRQGIHAGKLHIIMHGRKLKGEYALVKTFGRRENSWLLFKIKDKYATTDDITLKNRSVISNKTLTKVEATASNFYGGQRVKESKHKSKKDNLSTNLPQKAVIKKIALKKVAIKKEATSKKPSVKKEMASTSSKRKDKETDAVLKEAGKSVFPVSLKPMLATLVNKPFDNTGWLYEVKWDGYRAIAYINDGVVELKSRNDKSFNDKFYPVFNAVSQWGINAVVDGEIVVVNDKGISDFGALQNWRSEADGTLLFYVFDILWFEGKNLTSLPLTSRRKILEKIVPEEGIIKLSESFDVSGIDFFETVKKIGLEGMMAKKSDSTYQIGNRSGNWLKIKANKRQEMVIGGYTKNTDSRKPFSSLLVGVFDKGKLVYTGKIGTGFDIKSQKDMLKQFKPLIAKKTPFNSLPDINKPSSFIPDTPHAEATWLKPELVCEVSFTEMTRDGVMRHPSFEGLRVDKNASDVILENAFPVNDLVAKADQKEMTGTSGNNIIVPVTKKAAKTFLNPSDETQVRDINGHQLKFTNLSKIYWPEDGVSKRDLLNYYYQVSSFILPYLKDRPQSLNRHPNGIHNASFYQKDVTSKVPDWIETYRYHNSADDKDRHFMVCSDEASLLYMASLGCIELNPWSSRTQSPDSPDWCIIDLDPDENSFDQVITAAQVTHEVLESMKITSYCKTSGSTGIHIYIPLGAKYSYDQSKELARVIVTIVHREIPK